MRMVLIKAKDLKRGSKYKNKIIENENGKFDSMLEFKRFNTLELLRKSKSISCLKRQVRIKLSTVIDLKCDYIADFVYLDSLGGLIIEDVKGFETKEFKVKMKWLLTKYNNFVFRIVKGRTYEEFSGVGSIDLKMALGL